MTYDEQLIKWAAKRFGILPADIEKVSVDTDFMVSEGCPTCGPETELNLEVFITMTDGPTQYKEIDIKYGRLNEILKELFEA